MATKTRTLQVVCPKCFDADAAVTLDLNDLDLCTCCGCDETFTAAQAVSIFADMASRWEAVDNWIRTAPVV